jgi:S-adenosylmethionine synthetase
VDGCIHAIQAQQGTEKVTFGTARKMAKNYVPAGGELSDAIAKALKEVRNAAERFQVGCSLTQ